jgi:shikimate 5-dehydrogenase
VFGAGGCVTTRSPAAIPIPPRTRLIREAEARARDPDGLGMLVNQATIGIKGWTGVDL